VSKEEKNVCDGCHQEILWSETAILNVSLDIIFQTGTDPEKPMGLDKVHMKGDFHYCCFDHEILRKVAIKSGGLGTFWKHPIRESWMTPARGPTKDK